MSEFGCLARIIKAEVMHVGLLEVAWQRSDTKRKGVPPPINCAQCGESAFNHIAGHRAQNLDGAKHGIRAVRIPMPKGLSLREAHAKDSLVAPMSPGVGITDAIAGLDNGNRLGGRIQVA